MSAIRTLIGEGIRTLGEGPAPWKFLMLHEHGSSGSRLYFKTRSLQEQIRLLIRQHTGRDVIFHFPDAPLLPDGFGDDNFAWGLGDYRVDRVPCLDKSIVFLLTYMARHGPFDGVIGSSAGSTLAVVLAAMLERPGRCPDLMPFRFNHPPFRFVIGYSGFIMEHPCYQSLYSPKLRTPALFMYGEVDTFVPGELTERLAGQFMTVETLKFWGGHHVPRQKETDDAAIDYLRRVLTGEIVVNNKEEAVVKKEEGGKEGAGGDDAGGDDAGGDDAGGDDAGGDDAGGDDAGAWVDV